MSKRSDILRQMRSLKRQEKDLQRQLDGVQSDRREYDRCIRMAWEVSGIKSIPEKATDFEWALVCWASFRKNGVKDEVLESISERMGAYKFLLTESRVDFGREWEKSAFARLSLGHRVGAALALTSAPDDEVRAPWSAWSLQVPDHLIPIEGHDESTADPEKRGALKDEADRAIREALDIRGGHRLPEADLGDLATSSGWSSSKRREERLSTEDKKEIIHEMLDELAPPACDIQRVFCLGSEPAFALARTEATKSFVVLSHHGRERPPVWWDLLRNLVKGACIVLEGTGPKTPSKGGKWSSSLRGKNGPPEGVQYELGKEVAIDLRQELRRVLGGSREGASPAVQFLVRGHWRNQAHGEGRALRRRQWIEPFWKGPEEARALLRGHAVKD